MTAQIIDFTEYKYVKLSGICYTCGASWTAEVMRSTYKGYVQNKHKYICPFCHNADTGMALKTQEN